MDQSLNSVFERQWHDPVTRASGMPRLDICRSRCMSRHYIFRLGSRLAAGALAEWPLERRRRGLEGWRQTCGALSRTRPFTNMLGGCFPPAFCRRVQPVRVASPSAQLISLNVAVTCHCPVIECFQRAGIELAAPRSPRRVGRATSGCRYRIDIERLRHTAARRFARALKAAGDAGCSVPGSRSSPEAKAPRVAFMVLQPA